MSAARDYFPVKPGLVLQYRTKNASGEGVLTIEVLTVGTYGDIVTARCLRTTKWGREKSAQEYDVLKDGTGVYTDNAPEFPMPPRVGRKWDRYPNAYEIEDDEAVTTVPAGTFRDCLKITYLIAGGDAGSGERYYAPGIGLVRENCTDESDPYEFTLTKVGGNK